jgi:ABC-type sugar transport system ATPase subunit
MERVERLGSETNLYRKVADKSSVAVVQPDSRIKIGDVIEIGLDMSKAHFFKPDGIRI